MAEQVSLGVLRAGLAEIGADPPIGRRALGNRTILDRHAAQPHKAAPVNHLGAQPVEHRPERRQREIVAGDLGDIEAARPHVPRCLLDFGDFRRRQAIRPLGFAPAHIGPDPGRRPLDQPPRRRCPCFRGSDRLEQRHGSTSVAADGPVQVRARSAHDTNQTLPVKAGTTLQSARMRASGSGFRLGWNPFLRVR